MRRKGKQTALACSFFKCLLVHHNCHTTKDNSKLTSAQVDKKCELSIQLQCPLSGEKHCECNEVEHGDFANKRFASTELLYNTADNSRLESQHFRATCSPLFP